MKTNKPCLILVLTIVGLFLSGFEIFPQQTADQLYEKALYLEEAKGEMQQAIDLYQEVIKKYPENRQVVAKALLHAGFCYEKLGLKEAQQVYRRVINDYSENKNEVSLARARLTSLERTLAELKQKPDFRKIEIASEPQNGIVSPDGKTLAFTSDNGVWLVPLQSNLGNNIAGEPVRIADVQGASNFFNIMAWSANGQWIAVNSGYNEKDFVYIIPVKGGEQRKVQLPNRDAGNFPFRLSLSPDGEKLAFSALEPGVSTQNANLAELHIYVISSKGSEPKQISPGPGTSPSFSPDGKLIAYVTHREKKEPPKNVQATRYDSELWVVNSSGGIPIKLAVADGRLGGPVWSPNGRFIAAQGRVDVGGKEIRIYPLSPDASSVGEPAIIALPGYSMGMLAGWTPDNELGVFIRSEYRSAVYTVPSSGGRAVQVTPEGVVYYPRWSPDGKRIFLRWVKQDEVPPVQIVYVSATGGNVVKVPWPEKGLMSRVPGGGHNISPDGQKLIVSASEEPYGSVNYMDLRVIPLDGGQPVRLTNDESHEKYPCWSPDGKWIGFVGWQKTTADKGFDAIYRIPSEGGKPIQITSVNDSVGVGAISFTQDGKRIAFFSQGMIKTIPAEGGKSEVLVAKAQSDRWSQLAWSPDGSKIAYNTNGKIWITTLATGEKTDLKTGLPENFTASEFDWSPDGKKITFMTTSGDEPEFWLISNFLPLDKLAQKNGKENLAEHEGLKIRQIWRSPWLDDLGTVSYDGQFRSYVDWGVGDVAIQNLITGEKKKLTDKASLGDTEYFALGTAISNDGKTIASSWWKPYNTTDLVLVDVKNPTMNVIYSKEGEEVYPAKWLSDKELVATRYLPEKRIAQIVSFKIPVKTPKIIKSFEKIQNLQLACSPDEKYIAYSFANDADNGNSDINLLSAEGDKDIPLIRHPANDKVLGWVPGRKEFLFLSDRSGTWDLWAITLDDGKPDGSVKRIYTDIGEVSPMGFTQNGNCYFGFVRRNFNTYIVPFNSETGELKEGSGKSLIGSNIWIKWSPDGQYLAYIKENAKADTPWQLTIQDLKTGEERKIANNLLFARMPCWSPDGNSILVQGTEKNKYGAENYKGGIFLVDVKTGQTSEILLLSDQKYTLPEDDSPPLSDIQWSSDGKSIFYLLFKDRLVKRDLATGKEKILYENPNFERLVLNCSPDGKWLLFGVTDPAKKKNRLLTMSVEGGEVKELCTLQESVKRQAKWSPDGKYIYFTEISDGTSLWRIPAEGGTPQKIWHSKNDTDLFSIRPDGKEIALGIQERTTEMRVIENLVQELEKLEKLP